LPPVSLSSCAGHEILAAFELQILVLFLRQCSGSVVQNPIPRESGLVKKFHMGHLTFLLYTYLADLMKTIAGMELQNRTGIRAMD